MGQPRRVVASLLTLLIVPVASWLAGCQENTPGRAGEPESGQEPTEMTIDLRSGAFDEGATIPTKYTKDGDDLSPPLSWSAPPAGTRSLALVCDDPDAPVGTWDHWVLWGLPPETVRLAEGLGPNAPLPTGARQGINSWKRPGYEGPSPPPGVPHRYIFRLYALDAELSLQAGAPKPALLEAMQGHILATGVLIGRYGR